MQWEIKGALTDVYETYDPSQLDYVPPDRQALYDVPKLDGLAAGMPFAVTVLFDTTLGNLYEDAILVRLENAASAVLSVGGKVFNLAGNRASIVDIPPPGAFIQDYFVIDPGDYPEAYDDLSMEYTLQLNLPGVPGFSDAPLSLTREVDWTGAGVSDSFFAYQLLDQPWELGLNGVLQLEVTSFKSTLVSDAPAPIPLPAGFPLLAGALAGLGLMRRRARA